MNDNRRTSDRIRRPSVRYTGWYGLRMITASREKRFNDDNIRIPDTTEPTTDMSISESATVNENTTDISIIGHISSDIPEPTSDFSGDIEMEYNNDLKLAQQRKSRDHHRRATGFTVAKRRRRELQVKMFSFSPPERRTVYRRIVVQYDSDDECDGDNNVYENIELPRQALPDNLGDFERQGSGEMEHRKTRKRTRNESEWKRNVRKQARLQGQSYVSSRGKVIAAQVPPVDENLCGKTKCRLDCSGKVDNEARKRIMCDYYGISAEAQNAHLFASLQCSAPKSVIVDAHRHREIVVKYSVCLQGSRLTVCKRAFMKLYGISQSKVDHIVMQARNGQAAVRSSFRGKHDNRPNRLSEESINFVVEHIKSYPAEASHYSRSDNPNRLYLSPILTISMMYRQYQTWSAERNIVAVSGSAYRKIFCTRFNLGFGSPRSDTCSKCETTGITTDLTRHKELAEAAFRQQREDRAQAQKESNVFYITFDLEKTLPLPKLSVSTAFYLRQLWVYNCGIHLISKEKSGPHFCVWTEDQAGRGVTEVASSLLAFLQTSQISDGTVIAWSDSCSGQNKNFLMICFWQYLMAKKMLTCIHHKYPEPGHSFLDSDRDFGRIEVAVRRREKILSLDMYCDIMLKSSTNPKPTLTTMGDKMSNIAGLPTLLGLRKADKNVNGDKIELRDKVKWIKMTKFGYYEYKHSFDENESWKKVCLLKTVATNTDDDSSNTSDIPDIPLIPGRHAIKKAKLDDIKEQLKYIPTVFQGYYKSVIARSEETVECGEESDELQEYLDEQQVSLSVGMMSA